MKSLSRWSRATSAYAVVPSSEICAAPSSANGLATPTTWSLSATSVKIASARACTSGERTPSSEWTTIWMVSPAFCGKLLLEGVRGGLRLRPGLQVVLLELAAERAGQGEGAHAGRRSRRRPRAGASVAPVSQTYQHVRSPRVGAACADAKGWRDVGKSLERECLCDGEAWPAGTGIPEE